MIDKYILYFSKLRSDMKQNRWSIPNVDISKGTGEKRCAMQNAASHEKHRPALEELYERYIKLVYSFALKSTKDEQMTKGICFAVIG